MSFPIYYKLLIFHIRIKLKVMRITNTTIILISCLINTFYPRMKDIEHFDVRTFQMPSTKYFNLASRNKINEENFQEIKQDICDIREGMPHATEYYYFIPVVKAKLKLDNRFIKFKNTCFKTNKIILEKFSKAETIIIRSQ
jgi:hypothetical protein